MPLHKTPVVLWYTMTTTRTIVEMMFFPWVLSHILIPARSPPERARSGRDDCDRSQSPKRMCRAKVSFNETALHRYLAS